MSKQGKNNEEVNKFLLILNTVKPHEPVSLNSACGYDGFEHACLCVCASDIRKQLEFSGMFTRIHSIFPFDVILSYCSLFVCDCSVQETD